MPNSAFQTKYRQEMIAGYEQNMSLLRHTVTTDHDPHAEGVVFLVSDTGGARARQRGRDARIPARQQNLNQFTLNLQEYHDLVERGGFNIYASQGDGVRDMQMSTIKVINRECDINIFGVLGQATNRLGGAATASGNAGLTLTLENLQGAIAWLQTQVKDTMGAELCGVISPAMRQRMMTWDEFSSSDYIDDKRFPKQKDMAFMWNGVKWIVHTNVPDIGTNNAKCYIYAKNAVGHAFNSERFDVRVDYDEKNDSSWARATIYMGSLMLQQTGVIQIPHNDLGLIGTIGS